MSWTPDIAYLSGIDFFNDVVQSVNAQDWQRPSPCVGWSAVDVLGHVGIAVEFGTGLLRGEQPEWRPVDPPGQAVSGDPTQWWSAKVEPAQNAVQGVDLTTELDSPTGRRSIGQGLSFPAVDLFVHGWDLARSTGRDVQLPEDAIEFTHQTLDAFPAEQVRNSRVFGDVVEVATAASATQRFIAWTGRDPEWRASA